MKAVILVGNEEKTKNKSPQDFYFYDDNMQLWEFGMEIKDLKDFYDELEIRIAGNVLDLKKKLKGNGNFLPKSS